MSDFVETELRSTGASLFAGGATVDYDTLLELGWSELVASERRAAVTALAEAQGAQLGRSRLVELVIDAELGLDPATLALGFPLGELVSTNPSDALVLAPSDTVVVPVGQYGLVQLCQVAAKAEPVGGVDPDAGLLRIRGRLGPVVAAVETAVWDRAVGLGALALAHETIGVTQALLDLAVEHVRDRRQFGVPIGTFQAVQHRLADVHVRTEAARAVCRTAWEGGRVAHGIAALLAARTAAASAAEHCHQVLGAMGCTWEHQAHRYIRRAEVLALLLQAGRDLPALVTGDVLAVDQVEVFG